MSKEAFDEYWAGDDTKPVELEDAVLEYVADTNQEFQDLEDELGVIEETDPVGKTAEHKKVMGQLDKILADFEAEIKKQNVGQMALF